MSATASVQMTEPLGPTVSAIVNDGSPGPPATSSTVWPSRIRASSIRAAVTGANIVRIVALYSSQYGADSVHSLRVSLAWISLIAFELSADWLTLFTGSLRQIRIHFCNRLYRSFSEENVNHDSLMLARLTKPLMQVNYPGRA